MRLLYLARDGNNTSNIIVRASEHLLE